MVFIKENNVPPLQCKTSRVVGIIFFGSDDKCQVVKIKTSNEKFKRSMSKICPHPVNSWIII